MLSAGGEPNQVLGDGLLALFGMDDQPDVACRQAIAASAAIAARVESLNSALGHALVEPIRFGIGIHAGVTIAGAIGYERHAQFTVIGDPVNVAAPPRGADQDARLRSVDVRGGLRARRLRPGRSSGSRGRRARTRGYRESPQRRAGGGFGPLDRRAGAGGVVSGQQRILLSNAARTKVGVRQIGVGRIERHQLQHHAIGPAKAVLGRILAAPARLVGCDHVVFFHQFAG